MANPVVPHDPRSVCNLWPVLRHHYDIRLRRSSKDCRHSVRLKEMFTDSVHSLNWLPIWSYQYHRRLDIRPNSNLRLDRKRPRPSSQDLSQYRHGSWGHRERFKYYAYGIPERVAFQPIGHLS